MKKDIETASILLFVTIFPFAGFVVFFLLLYILFCTKYFYITIIYFTWMWLDRKACFRGGRRLKCVTNLTIWKHASNYFPVKITKTAEIDPNKNYLCGYHPHGIGAFGAISTFAFQNGFKENFPRMKSFLITTATLHWIPFIREFLGCLGVSAFSKENITWILSRKGKGNMAVVAVGGTKESLYASPKQAKLILKNEKEFIKIALKTGTSLLPMFSFGENELYEQPLNEEGTFFRLFQSLFLGIFQFPQPIVYGEQILPFIRWSHLPRRRRVDVVVGEPIEVVSNGNPTEGVINYYHKMYIDKLCELYENHKKNYDAYKNVQLEIL